MRLILWILGAVCAILLIAAGVDRAQAASIYTGGEQGAYHSTFCPTLPQALSNKFFTGYACQTSGGTGENITNVQKNPTDIGFVQLDAYLRAAETDPTLASSTKIIREIACEGLWMITKNPDLKEYGTIQGLARRLPVFLPAEKSGAAATFRYMQSLDPDGLGMARNINYLGGTDEVIDRIAAGEPGVGFFVQFADPTNANIKKLVDEGLYVIPVVSRQLLDTKIAGVSPYKVQSFQLKSGGIFSSGTSVVTACTPAAIITGSPDLITDASAKANQQDLISTIGSVPISDLLPAESKLAKLLAGIKDLSSAAVDEMIAASDIARSKAQELLK